MQESMSLKYEPASEPLHISVKGAPYRLSVVLPEIQNQILVLTALYLPNFPALGGHLPRQWGWIHLEQAQVPVLTLENH